MYKSRVKVKAGISIVIRLDSGLNENGIHPTKGYQSLECAFYFPGGIPGHTNGPYKDPPWTIQGDTSVTSRNLPEQLRNQILTPNSRNSSFGPLCRDW